MARLSLTRRILVILLALTAVSTARATNPDPADHSIREFLARKDTHCSYRAVRYLDAESRHQRGWLEALTEYSPEEGFRYEVISEGGSDYVRSKVLKAVLNGERNAIAHGAISRSSFDPANYVFQPDGIDADGYANVLLSPRRKEHMLVAGMMKLDPADGALIRVQGRLAKSPSFWVKSVDIVRIYDRINGAVLPVSLDTKAKLRWLGEATLRMTYTYSHVDGRPVPPPAN